MSSRFRLQTLGLLMLLSLAGCNRMRVRVDNPLVGPPPPRDPERVAEAIALEEAAGSARLETDPGTSLANGAEQQLGVVLIGQTVVDAPPVGVSDLMTQVAARVNGRPIFVGEIIEPVRLQLEAARVHPEMTDEIFDGIVSRLVLEDLEERIDQALLVDSLMSTLKQEQKDQVEAQIDTMFEERIVMMQEQLEASTLADLEMKLQEQGTSLASLRRRFGDVQIAGQAMAMKLGDPDVITRADLLAEYQASIDEFKQPTQVRWQQIWVSRGREQEALSRIQQAQSALQQGATFTEVVREFSQGATLANDGDWDWTRPESLGNQEVAALLNSLPIGQFSEIIADRRGYQIVMVTERRNSTITPFEEVQDQLRERLLAEREQASIEAVLAELRASAVIERYFE